MNQAACDLVAREAHRAVAQDRQDYRAGYRHEMVNPRTLDDYMHNFPYQTSPDARWETFCRDYPDAARLSGAYEYFATVYQRAVDKA